MTGYYRHMFVLHTVISGLVSQGTIIVLNADFTLHFILLAGSKNRKSTLQKYVKLFFYNFLHFYSDK